jgi:hypothetical protein
MKYAVRNTAVVVLSIFEADDLAAKAWADLMTEPAAPSTKAAT